MPLNFRWRLARLTPSLPARYIHHLLQSYLSPSRLLPRALSLARQNLFPNNSLPPPSPPAPGSQQFEEIRRDCAEAIISLFPPLVSRQLLGSNREEWVKEVEIELDVWKDSWMNKHLAYRILELVFVRVLPELEEKGVQELMEARLGAQQHDEAPH